jgi:anti-sigma B factor antagonist
LVLALEGTLDVLTAPRAIEVLQQFVQQHGPDIVLDMARLDFIDSKGVGALLSGVKASRDAGGMVYLQNPATPVKKILEMCGLLALFPPRPERKPEPAVADPARTAPSRPTGTAPAARTAARPAAAPARPLKRAA